MEIKNYRQMTHDEQIAVIKKVAEYVHTDLPKLQALGVAFDEEAKKTFFRGVDILSNFSNCRSFCTKCGNVRSNWDQYTNRMSYLFGIVRKRIAEEMQVSSRGEQVIVLPQTQSLRRGRPTEEESRQREKERQVAERAQAIASLTGARLATQEAAPVDTSRQSDTSRRKEEELDLFGSAIEAETSVPSAEPGNTEKATVPTIPAAEETKRPLRDWIFMMPDNMAEEVRNLRDTIGRRDYEAQQAKLMAERGDSEADIKEHTTAARDINMSLRDLYASIDDLLGLYYVMLTKVNKDFGKFAAKYEKQGGYDSLVNDLLPYYEKMTSSNANWAEEALNRAKAMEAKRIEDETRNPELEKEIHKIKAYFKRTDMKVSKKRLDTLNNYLARARELGIDEDTLAGFEVIIQAETEKLTVNS